MQISSTLVTNYIILLMFNKSFNLAKDGHNLAFIYNVSNSDRGIFCPRDLVHFFDGIGKPLFRAFDNRLESEVDQYLNTEISMYDLIRPSVRDRFAQIYNEFRVYMEENNPCLNCTKYRMESVEGAVNGEAKRLDVGTWSQLGGRINDVLFPHVVHGFRARTLQVGSFEVRSDFFSYFRRF